MKRNIGWGSDESPGTVGFDVLSEDIVADQEDLTDRPVVMSMVTSNQRTGSDIAGSETWTFYSISTNFRTVVLRRYGNSNGNYLEAVNFEMTPDSEMAKYLCFFALWNYFHYDLHLRNRARVFICRLQNGYRIP